MKKSPRYLEELMKRKSFPDFLKAMNYFTDPKEWTETWGMLRFLNKTVFSQTQIDYVYEIGCGKRPTLGTLIALNIKSVKGVRCVDPNLDKSYATNIKGITLIDMEIASYSKGCVGEGDSTVLVCANHAHVSKNDMWRFLFNFKNAIYVTCPCCIDNRLDGYAVYKKDPHVWSPKNDYYYYDLRERQDNGD